jgi:hypothetical protein
MHADDEYHEDYLSEMINFLEANNDVSLLHCSSNIINFNSKKIFSFKNYFKNFSSPRKQLIFSGYSGLLWISKFNKIMAPSVIYRSVNFCNKLSFDSDLKYTLDWDFYFRSLLNGVKISKLNKSLLNYRVHSQQQSSKLSLSMEKYIEIASLLIKMKTYLNVPNKPHKNHNFFLFFYSTMIFDALSDLFLFKFSNFLNKIKFLFTIFKNNQVGKL